MMNNGGKLQARISPSLADYYVRTFRNTGGEAYRFGADGTEIAGSPQTWDSCIYTGEEERDFVRDYLGQPSMMQDLAI